MDRVPVQSSNLRAVGYDAALLLLEVEFQSGSVYAYRRVPPQVYEALLKASSKGSYFTAHIRTVYPSERLR
jgi:hypothetical protein